MDLIDRQQAKDTVVDTFHAVVKKENIYISAIITAIVQEIGKLPSAQKTGHWVQWNEPGCEHTECSVCKTAYDQIDLYIGGSEYPNYCPNCGASMRGEEE